MSSSLLVPVRVTASGAVSGSMAGEASASFAFTFRNGYYSDSIANLIGSTRGMSSVIAPTFSSIFSVDQIVYVAPNFDLFVKLDTSSQSSGLAPVSWALSFVDPTFSIADPALAAPYHFEGIPGMAAAVPEPAQWALMLLGLGALSGLHRRQRKLARLALCRSGTIATQARLCESSKCAGTVARLPIRMRGSTSASSSGQVLACSRPGRPSAGKT